MIKVDEIGQKIPKSIHDKLNCSVQPLTFVLRFFVMALSKFENGVRQNWAKCQNLEVRGKFEFIRTIKIVLK